MIKMFRFLLIMLTLVLTGCASTVTSSGGAGGLNIQAANTKKVVMTVKAKEDTAKSSDWQQLRQEWNNQMTAVTKTTGIAYQFQEKDITSSAEEGTLVGVRVNDYRYVTESSRILVGVMTGNAWMDVDVEFRDLKTGNLIGTRNYQTKSSAWEGVFSAMTEKQLESICTEIVSEIGQHRDGSKVSAVTNAVPAPIEAASSVNTSAPVSAPDPFVTPAPVVAPLAANVATFKAGQSSVTVEKIAKQQQCTSEKGAGLVSNPGIVEDYALQCTDGRQLSAHCEYRQCLLASQN